MRSSRSTERLSAAQNVLVLTYWSYDDALVQTYTLPYVRIITTKIEGKVHLVTLDRNAAESGRETGDPRIVHHGFRYVPFGLRAVWVMVGVVWKLLRIIRKERVDVIHAWCTPAGAVGYLLSILSGRPLIIDSYEPHAEAMVENGTWKKDSWAFRILFKLEKLQTHRAAHLIAAAHGMQTYAADRYDHHGPMYVKPACVEINDFPLERDARLLEELHLNDKLVMVYAGKFGGIYLKEEVFHFFRQAQEHWGDRLHILLLTNHSMGELRPLMEKAGLDETIFTIRFVPHAEIPRYLSLADIGITPVKPVPTKKYCTPIKDGEYWAAGLLVIITPEISDDSRIVEDENIGVVLRSFDREGYRKAVQDIDRLLEKVPRELSRAHIRSVAMKYRSFDRAEKIYEAIYGKR